MRIRATAVAAALALALTACGGDGEGPASPEPGATADPNAPELDMQRSTEDRLPEGFPSDFPVPEQRTVTESIVVVSGFTVYMTTSMDAAALRAFYTTEFPRQGWKITQCTVSEPDQGSMTVIVAQKGNMFSAVTVQSGKTPEGIPYDFIVMVSEIDELPDQPADTCPPQ